MIWAFSFKRVNLNFLSIIFLDRVKMGIIENMEKL
jgi:hypothetical protein